MPAAILPLSISHYVRIEVGGLVIILIVCS